VGIIPGIQSDTGAKDMQDIPVKKITKASTVCENDWPSIREWRRDSLCGRAVRVRSVIGSCPVTVASDAKRHSLGSNAATCAKRLIWVPIVEPEG